MGPMGFVKILLCEQCRHCTNYYGQLAGQLVINIDVGARERKKRIISHILTLIRGIYTNSMFLLRDLWICSAHEIVLPDLGFKPLCSL